MADLLHVDGLAFDPEDLSYGEKREVRRLIRTELWDEDLDGSFDWDAVGENEVLPATICVFMRRDRPEYTLVEALAHKPRDVYRDDDEVPPTSSEPA